MCYPSLEFPQYCIFLEQQARALISLGNKVDILVPFSDKSNQSILKRQKINDLNVYRLSYCTFRYNLFLNISKINFINKLKNFLIKNRYDVVSLHIVPDGLLNDFVELGKKLSIKVVRHFHGQNVWANYHSKYPLIERINAIKRKKILERIDAIVGVSSKVCWIIRSRLKNKKIFFVFNGVDLNIFHPNKIVIDKTFNISCVANLLPTKGQKFLIWALAEVIKKVDYKKIHLDIVGRGDDFEFLKNEIKKYQIENNVLLHGLLPYKEVAKIIADSHVFVLPSFFEAWGCVFLEAMACKVPIICCKNQGIAEVIKDGVDGLLIDAKSTSSIVDKLMILIKNEDLRKKIGHQGYLKVQNYTWLHSAKELDKVYDIVLNFQDERDN